MDRADMINPALFVIAAGAQPADRTTAKAPGKPARRAALMR
jgi:hypothetical protein